MVAAFTASTPLSLNATSLYGRSLSTVGAPRIAPVPARCRRSRVRMGAPAIIKKKSAIVDKVKEKLNDSEMIFSIPLPGLTVANIFEFKKKLPEGTTAMAVKNTLMRRAIEGSGWEVAGNICKESSIWIFVKDDIKGSVEAYKTFAKELELEPIKGGVLEETFYDTDGISAIAALPSKLELITQVARLVKEVPTKLAVSIKEVPTKLARGIKLAVADEEKGDESAAGEPGTETA